MYWESAQSANGDELDATLVPLARLTLGDIYIRYAFLDGEYVYAGSRGTWVVWNWRRNEILNLRLEVRLLISLLPSITDVPFSFQMLYTQYCSRRIL